MVRRGIAAIAGVLGCGSAASTGDPATTGTTGSEAVDTLAPPSTESTGPGATGAAASDDAADAASDTTEGTTGLAETTGAEVPAFDELPWQTGEAIGYGIAYKDSEDPDARNVFIGYAGYPFPLDASQSWVTALYHARLRELGVRHVYAVQGPQTVLYTDLEVGNSSIAEALATQAVDASFVLVAAHSSGSYVAHELLGQLAGGLDPGDVTADKVVYFDLDGGTAGLDDAAVDRLRRAYFVSVRDGSTGTSAPNRDAMQYLATLWPDKGGYLELDGAGSGCNAGAPWCLHMVVINSLPHDPSDSDVIDYYDFVDRPVVTAYIDSVAARAGLVP